MRLKKHKLILILIIIVLISGCTKEEITEQGEVKINKCEGVYCPMNYKLNETSCDCIFIGREYDGYFYPRYHLESGISYDYFFEPCNRELSQRGILVNGVNNIKWLNDKLLEIDVIAEVNCAFGIRDAGADVKRDNIFLWYGISRPSQEEPLYACVCGHELVYRINNLEKQEYNISLEAVG